MLPLAAHANAQAARATGSTDESGRRVSPRTLGHVQLHHRSYGAADAKLSYRCMSGATWLRRTRCDNDLPSERC